MGSFRQPLSPGDPLFDRSPKFFPKSDLILPIDQSNNRTPKFTPKTQMRPCKIESFFDDKIWTESKTKANLNLIKKDRIILDCRSSEHFKYTQ